MHLDDEGNVLLTQAQLSGINAGVAQGESLLLAAPTSSGKTLIGLLAASSWLRGGDGLSRQVIYLVTHRALARQKFKELRQPNFLSIFDIGPDELLLATGDEVVDAGDAPVDDPLAGRLIVATYEKYLALLAGSGLRHDMSHVCIVADELQILGDQNRGRAVEVLLTIIRSAEYGQFVGLSAVLSQKDSETIAGWMGVKLVAESVREVPLTYELRTSVNTYEWHTDRGDEVFEISAKKPTRVIEILNELAADADANFPVAVFCMTKRRIGELIAEWGRRCPTVDPQLDLSFEEPTASSAILASSLPKGFGVHTADLIDVERAIVEERLEQDELPIIFATTTLAQGLNFSFKTVIFDHWARFVFAQRQEFPIPYSEFHNIAGRAGRLGLQDRGRVILNANSGAQTRAASKYLTPDLSEIQLGYLDVSDFEAVALQLISSGLAASREDLLTFLSDSLTGYVERDRTRDVEEDWNRKLDATVGRLREWGFIK